MLLRRSARALGQKTRTHEFFFYDRARVISGMTREIGQPEIEQVSRAPKRRRIEEILSLSSRYTEIPLGSIESIALHVGPTKDGVDKMTIKGNNQVITVDIDTLRPSLNFSIINGTAAFSAISLSYTYATGKSIPAVIQNP
jgi:hypothetical protein